MKDTMIYTMYGKDYRLKFLKAKYQNNGNTAIRILCKEGDEEFYEPFGVLTVNVKTFSNPYKACIDTNNMPEDLLEHLKKEGVYAETDTHIRSGYRSYPVVLFNRDWLDALAE